MQHPDGENVILVQAHQALEVSVGVGPHSVNVPDNKASSLVRLSDSRSYRWPIEIFGYLYGVGLTGGRDDTG